MGGGTAGTSQSLGGCPPAHLGAQQCRCTSRRGQGSRKGVCTPTCTRIHRRTHLWVSICIDTCTQPRPDIPQGQLCVCVSTHTIVSHTHPCQLTVLLAAANSSHCRLSWAWHFKASMMEPQQTAPATPPQASLDTPGLTTGGEPFHRCLCVCGGVRHSGGAPGQMVRSPLYRHLLSEPERVCTIPFLLRPCPGQHQTLTCPELVLSAGEGGRGVWQEGHPLEEAALSTCTCRVFTPVAFGPYRHPSPPFLSPFTEK